MMDTLDSDPRHLAAEIGRAFAERRQLDELIPFAIARCRAALDAESVVVLLLDGERNELYCPLLASPDRASGSAVPTRFPADQGIAGAVLRGRRSIRTDDASADVRFVPGVDEHTGQNPRAFLCTPLSSPGAVIGVIEAANLLGSAIFDDHDLAMIEALAEPLGRAIANAVDSPHSAVGSGLKSPLLPLPLEPAVSMSQGEGRSEGAARAEAVFRKEGEYWTIVFDGTVARLKDAKGLHYLAYLLRHPGQEFHVGDLVAAIGDTPETSQVFSAAEAADLDIQTAASDGVGAILDAKAKADYKQRLDDLRDELEEAERFHDSGRAERAGEEIEFISQQVAGALGLGGRDRNVASGAERARLAVTKRIKAALKKIQDANPALARHLNGAVTTGYFCTYAPKANTATSWSL
jgi:hypothetical protein